MALFMVDHHGDHRGGDVAADRSGRRKICAGDEILRFILLTISLLTTRRRIHALIWLMVISLAFFGSKGGVFTIIHGGGGGRVEGPPAR